MRLGQRFESARPLSGPKPILLATAVAWMYFYLRSHSEAMPPAPKRAPPPRARVVGGGGRSAGVGLRVEMGPLRKSISVRLEEGVHARLRRQSLRSGVPTSALVRALVHRWLDEQDEAGKRPPGRQVQNGSGSRGSSARKESLEGPRRTSLVLRFPSCLFIRFLKVCM